MEILGVDHHFADEVEASFAPEYCRLEFRRAGKPVARVLLPRDVAISLGVAIEETADGGMDMATARHALS